MKREDAEEYTQALGQVVAGGWRQVALGDRLGVPAALGLSTREWVEDRLGGYVRLAIPERRAAAAELAEEGHSTREIAEVLGVDHATAARDLAVANATPENGTKALPVANATPDPIDTVVEAAIADAKEMQARLDAVQPFEALRAEDTGYMAAWGRVHTKFSHAITDVLGFDIERVAFLADEVNIEALRAGVQLAEAYRNRLLAALERCK